MEATEQPVLSPDVVAVADNVSQLMRSFARTRARVLDAAAHAVEWTAQLVLKCLANEGPLRSSAIAEHVRADPSTVSRQVAALVKEGLVERRADPEDGRASLLVLTDKADETVARHDDIRNRYFAAMLADWSERDLRRFADLMRRFTRDYESASTQWISERADQRHRSAEGEN
jgi:DNA-binding MarR family transcriptional regulator